jgi:hypothetical protein
MRLPFLAILTVAAAVPVLAQNNNRDNRNHERQGTVSEQRDKGWDQNQGVDRAQQGHDQRVVVVKREPGREVVIERRGAVVVEKRVPPRQVVRYRGYTESPQEWRMQHAREFSEHAYYSSHDRIILQSYSRRLPPGRVRFAHPEWRDRIIVGRPVPSDVIIERVPVEVEKRLPPLPPNYMRFKIGTSFFIKDIHTNIVIDAVL